MGKKINKVFIVMIVYMELHHSEFDSLVGRVKHGNKLGFGSGVHTSIIRVNHGKKMNFGGLIHISNIHAFHPISVIGSVAMSVARSTGRGLAFDIFSTAADVAGMGTIAFGHGIAANATLATFSTLIILDHRENIWTTQTFLGDIVGGALVTMGTRLPFEGLGRFVIVFGTLWHGQNRLGVGGCGEQVGLDPK